MPGESLIVEHRKELTYLLSQGAELEHALMCQYLYAAFSLKGAADPGLSDDQVERVEGWRRVILKIAGEEMLHWAVVQNLLAAVGSAPFRHPGPTCPTRRTATHPGCSCACSRSARPHCSISSTWSDRRA